MLLQVKLLHYLIIKKIWDENTNSVSESFKRFDFNWAGKFAMLID